MDFKIQHQIAILLIITMMGQLAMESYIPALPTISDFFNITPYYTQYSMGIFLMTMGFSQLLHGPFSDARGRRPVLLLGLCSLAMGSLFCLSSHSYVVFMLGRALQGFGAGATSNLTKSIARDLGEKLHLTKITSYVMVAWTTVFLMAPVLGGIIIHFMNWQWIFIFLSIIEILTLIIVILFFNETLELKNQHKRFRVKDFYSNIKTVLLNNDFRVHISICCLAFSSIVAFNLLAPFHIQKVLHFTALSYSLIILIISSGYILGSWINSFLCKNFKSNYINNILALVGLLSVLTMLILLSIFPYSIFPILITMPFFTGAVGVFISNSLANCMRPFRDIAGTASSVYGLIIFPSGFFVNIIVSEFVKNNFILLVYLLIIFIFLIMILNNYSRFSKKKYNEIKLL